MASAVISTFSRECVGTQVAARVHAGGSAPGSATWPSTSLALGFPLNLDRSYEVTMFWWANGAAVAGNVDVGVYTLNGALVGSAGATAQATTNVIQPKILGSPLFIPAGAYMIFMSCSSTTAQFWRQSTTALRNAQMLGMQQISGTVSPLPSQATFSSITSTYLPLFGITRVTYFT